MVWVSRGASGTALGMVQCVQRRACRASCGSARCAWVHGTDWRKGATLALYDVVMKEGSADGLATNDDGRLVCDLGAYRGLVERIAGQSKWTARVESQSQTYTSVFEYATLNGAQQWVERKIEILLRRRAELP